MQEAGGSAQCWRAPRKPRSSCPACALCGGPAVSGRLRAQHRSPGPAHLICLLLAGPPGSPPGLQVGSGKPRHWDARTPLQATWGQCPGQATVQERLPVALRLCVLTPCPSCSRSSTVRVWGLHRTPTAAPARCWANPEDDRLTFLVG